MAAAAVPGPAYRLDHQRVIGGCPTPTHFDIPVQDRLLGKESPLLQNFRSFVHLGDQVPESNVAALLLAAHHKKWRTMVTALAPQAPHLIGDIARYRKSKPSFDAKDLRALDLRLASVGERLPSALLENHPTLQALRQAFVQSRDWTRSLHTIDIHPSDLVRVYMTLHYPNYEELLCNSTLPDCQLPCDTATLARLHDVRQSMVQADKTTRPGLYAAVCSALRHDPPEIIHAVAASTSM